MSKILLAAVNASFSHTNIAVRSISLYCENPEVSFGEWTINQMMFEVLREIREKNPQMVIFLQYYQLVQTKTHLYYLFFQLNL